MAVGAILGTALTTHAARPQILTVGGTDVILLPTGGGNVLGTPIESIAVSEKGPGAVSTMSFTVEDPGLVMTIADGMEVRYHDGTIDVPIFAGWLDHWSVSPWAGTGAIYQVTAVGTESLLDWAILSTDLTFTGSNVNDAIQSIVANCYGIGPLRAFMRPSGGGTATQAYPMGNFTSYTILTMTVSAGTSLREGIRQVLANISFGTYTFNIAYTVDLWFGLRLYLVSATGTTNDDYTAFTVVDDPTTVGFHAVDLSYDTEAATFRGVFVKGLNAAGTGLITDGTGLLGPIAYVNDQTVDSAAKLAATGGAYLGQYVSKLRGSFVLEAFTRTALGESTASTIHPGAKAIVTDARVGLNAVVLLFSQIDKTFNSGGTENWTFSFGGLPPSAAALTRHLTLTARA
jgi:hypothetical protein